MNFRQQCAEQRFSQVNLREETKKLIEKKPQEEDLISLNRLLLEDAYPNEIAKSDNPVKEFFRQAMNTIDYFVPLIPPGPTREEDKQGIFRLSRPSLGKTGIQKR